MALIELTELLQQALENSPDQPLRLVDPRTKQTYVLLRTEVYDRVKAILGEEDELEGLDVGTLIDEAMREDDKGDLLLDSYQKYNGRP
jgi:hypothetical protein